MNGMRKNAPSSPPPVFPAGWFAVALSSELRRGHTLARRLCGEELALFRSESGQAVALDAFCPHLGAHLGHVGVVEGEQLRCRFHGFCFDSRGTCVATGYGVRPPRQAQLRAWPIDEQGGVIFVWFDGEHRPPAWRLPSIVEARTSPPIFERFVTPAAPLLTAENGVDMGHLTWVHRLGSVRQIEPARLDGPALHMRYDVDYQIPSAAWLGTFRLELAIQQLGLGCAVATFQFPAIGVRTQQLALATPVDHGHTEFLIGVRASEHAGTVLQRLAARAAARALFVAFRHEVQQDLAIWRHQRRQDRPALVAGDGPIAPYRRWARQFFPPLQSP
jgi:phenylpropionate dioxygenase-like ring-hydroxylating dioxygenase large terminal subunit